MIGKVAASVLAQYHWQLSLLALVAVGAITLVGSWLFGLVPAFRQGRRLNREVLAEKMQRPGYAANQRLNRRWGVLFFVMVYGLVLPFCLTLAPGPWWRILLDSVVILMTYDLLYYFMHRFLFHDNGIFGGPLKWMHATHHRQHNPCRMDSSYIHPLEVVCGLGLFTATIFVLARLMGDFHVATLVISWIGFMQINVHNHARWEAEHFPFRYLNYISKMHHNHHARFTGGNFATITPLFDWMFGTLDHGAGYGKRAGGRGRAVGS